MAKIKYKNMNADQKFIHDAVSMKKVRILGSLMFLAAGIWMALTPEGMEHASREKATVWLLKELWSPYLAAVFILGSIWALYRAVTQLKIMTGFTWVKQPGGHYIYKNKERVLGLKSIANGNDKIIFNNENGEVYNFVNYSNVGLNKFGVVKPNVDFNCNDTYWSADSKGYSMIHKGEYIENMSSEYKGNDLIVTAGELGKKFLLKNYKSNLDGGLRKAELY